MYILLIFSASYGLDDFYTREDVDGTAWPNDLQTYLFHLFDKPVESTAQTTNPNAC